MNAGLYPGDSLFVSGSFVLRYTTYGASRQIRRAGQNEVELGNRKPLYVGFIF